MKADELNAIDFESRLQYCYEDLQPILAAELGKLRSALGALPDKTSENEKLALFQDCVEALNAIDEDETVESTIDTDEREVLCDLLYEMGELVGLDADTEFVDIWRDW